MSDNRMFVISIARDYSPCPAGRTPKDGPFNGERFRNQFLVPNLEDAIEKGRKLRVDFDDADSYSSSFLEEAFGGLVRLRKFRHDDLRTHLDFYSRNPVFKPYMLDAKEYLSDAIKRK